MSREELFAEAKRLMRKSLELRGAGHIEGALNAEAEYRKVCERLAK